MTSSLTAFVICFFGMAHTPARAFEWPFNTTEFHKKLSSADLTPSVRYFARGPSFLKGQKWNEAKFLDSLNKQNYRIREPDQVLLPGDAKKITTDDCKKLSEEENTICWSWQTHDQETYTVVISSAQTIQSTWLGAPIAEPYWKASLDPILVAQYNDQQPVMQNELKIGDFPVNCMNAVMAIEDTEFLNHSGLSYVGLTRSLIKNITKMRYAQGGSTITQQLVKNYFLTPEKTLKRKLKELYLAVKLESEWTKDEILETYLNIVYMGQSGAFQVTGFGAASNYYFNKPVQKLDLSECALLAAIVNNPRIYNPWKSPDKALSRRNLVLSKMNELKLITDTEYNNSIATALPKRAQLIAAETAPYFFEAVRKQLTDLKLSTEQIHDIYTSLDLEEQQNAQTALQVHITELEKTRKNLISNKDKGLKLEGLVITTENQTGLIKSMVGGQNYRLTQFNRALNAKRQIGSLIKPFVYLTAVQNGSTPLTKINDQKFVWTYDKKNWSPVNYDKKFHGEVPLYYALKESLNASTAQTAYKFGIKNVIETAHAMGLTSDMDAVPATSLGASTHYPIEVIDAYRSLANFGQFTPSSFIEKIKDKSGDVLFQYTPKFEKRAEDTDTAIVVGMMKETLRSGTAKASASLGWTAPAAGKTGTTSDNKDAWFTGFTPFQTTVVWLGYDMGASSQLTGASGAVPIWVQMMKTTLNTWPENDFVFPKTVERNRINLFGTPENTELIFKKLE